MFDVCCCFHVVLFLVLILFIKKKKLFHWHEVLFLVHYATHAKEFNYFHAQLLHMHLVT
jgi:predicted cation transporter